MTLKEAKKALAKAEVVHTKKVEKLDAAHEELMTAHGDLVAARETVARLEAEQAPPASNGKPAREKKVAAAATPAGEDE